MSIDDLDTLFSERHKPGVKYLKEQYHRTPSNNGNLIFKGYVKVTQ